MPKLKKSLKDFIFNHTPATRILESYENRNWKGEVFTDIVADCAGDTVQYRVYGSKPKDYRIFER